jgi:hypothetical protein
VGAAGSVLEHRLEQVFGPASCRRWSRSDLQSLPAPLIAAGLRRAATDELGRGSDRLGGRQLWPAAEAVADDQRRPRVFHWTGGLVVEVRSGTVQLRRDGAVNPP